jgi:hypothetical protein
MSNFSEYATTEQTNGSDHPRYNDGGKLSSSQRELMQDREVAHKKRIAASAA